MQTVRPDTLQQQLHQWCGDDATHRAVAETLVALADASIEMTELVSQGPLAGNLAGVVGENADGDAQKSLDLRAHYLFMSALAQAPVAVVGSEEAHEPIVLDPNRPLVVVIDPLDGSSNIELNNAIGTIFGIYAKPESGDPADAVLQPGSRLLAAGFVVYGPFTSLLLSVGGGVCSYVLSHEHKTFLKVRDGVTVPPNCDQYAINASNYRYWSPAVRAFIDDCMEGVEGPRGSNFNMRWMASLVAEAYRIVTKGGVFLYPSDSRKGYESGRLRLVYEANPIAFLIEQAGGAATSVVDRILDLQPQSLHQRTPLAFGDFELVEHIRRYASDVRVSRPKSPLFASRGLFRSERR